MARPVRTCAISFCRSPSTLSMRVRAFISTSFTFLKELPLTGAASFSGFITLPGCDYRIVVPIGSPIAIRIILPGTFKSNTVIGIRLSRHMATADASITPNAFDKISV